MTRTQLPVCSGYREPPRRAVNRAGFRSVKGVIPFANSHSERTPAMAYGPPPSPGYGHQPIPPAATPGHRGLPQGPSGHDDTTWALMAYVGQFVVSVIAPLVVYVGRGRSPFVRWHAAQGLNMAVAAVAMWLVGGLLSLLAEVMIWLPLAFTAVTFVFLVYAARAANRGEFRRVPPFIAWPLFK
ncbi:hypothetical protein GCM10022214_42260 [Actinomadura miaoliensis]|uniref:DUF4870 domain-containing protein n=2 Tax=Actinomadura miaoliensis TaxID=430685 RepID=A0ABP7W2E2_9ACTN